MNQLDYDNDEMYLRYLDFYWGCYLGRWVDEYLLSMLGDCIDSHV